MPNKRILIRSFFILVYLVFWIMPLTTWGQDSVRYGKEIKKEAPVRYGPQIRIRPGVRYGVDISADDIRQVPPGEIIEEEVPSDFAFEMRNYLKLSGYYDKLMEYPNINPNNILELEETAYFLEFNTQFDLTYLDDYTFKADLSYQWSPGDDTQSDRDTHFITNEFYLDLYLAQLAYLRAGKKREIWGVGWTFSPVDNIIDYPKNLVDPTDSREGKYLAMLEVPVGNSAFSFVYFPDVVFDLMTEEGQSGIPDTMFEGDPSFGVRASFLIWDTDVSLIYYWNDRIPELYKNYFGLTLNRYWLDLGAYIDIEGHTGNDLEFVDRTEIGQYVFWMDEDLIEIKEDDDDLFINFAVGLNYTFSDDTKLTLEYYRNNEGYDENEFEDFVDFVEHEAEVQRLINDEFSEMKLLKANYLLGDRLRINYLSFSFDRPNTFDDFFPHLGVIVCLDDGSYLLNGYVTYNIRDDTSISVDVKAYVGEDDTEWGLKPDDYRVYLKVQYFF